MFCTKFTQGCFVPSFIDIGPVVLEKEVKMSKIYRDYGNLVTLKSLQMHKAFLVRLKEANIFTKQKFPFLEKTVSHVRHMSHRLKQNCPKLFK